MKKEEKPYWILLVREDGKWSVEFGDHTRSTVFFERNDYQFGYRRMALKDLHILKCSNGHFETVKTEVNEWIAKGLNGLGKPEKLGDDDNG